MKENNINNVYEDLDNIYEDLAGIKDSSALMDVLLHKEKWLRSVAESYEQAKVNDVILRLREMSKDQEKSASEKIVEKIKQIVADVLGE